MGDPDLALFQISIPKIFRYFLGRFTWGERHSISQGQIWYVSSWYKWRCNWGGSFLLGSQQEALKLKNTLTNCFQVLSLTLITLHILFLIESSPYFILLTFVLLRCKSDLFKVLIFHSVREMSQNVLYVELIDLETCSDILLSLLKSVSIFLHSKKFFNHMTTSKNLNCENFSQESLSSHLLLKLWSNFG